MKSAKEYLDDQLGVSSIKYPDIVIKCTIAAINDARLEVIDEILRQHTNYFEAIPIVTQRGNQSAELRVNKQSFDNLKKQIK